jgi:hypothetical protein
LGSLDAAHAVSYLEDMAVGLATLGERDEADGQIWHLPVNATLTGREFLTAVWQAIGQPAKIGRVGRLTVRIGGLFSPRTRELGETLGERGRSPSCAAVLRRDGGLDHGGSDACRGINQSTCVGAPLMDEADSDRGSRGLGG